MRAASRQENARAHSGEPAGALRPVLGRPGGSEGDGSTEVLVASYAGGEVAVLVGAATPLVVALIRRRRRASACFGSEGRRLSSRSDPGRRVGGDKGCVREERGQGFGPSWRSGSSVVSSDAADLFARLSSRTHPLDELVAGAALEQGVGHPVDAIGAR